MDLLGAGLALLVVVGGGSRLALRPLAIYMFGTVPKARYLYHVFESGTTLPVPPKAHDVLKRELTTPNNKTIPEALSLVVRSMDSPAKCYEVLLQTTIKHSETRMPVSLRII